MFHGKFGFLQFIQVDLSADIGPVGVVYNGQDVIGPVLRNEGWKKRFNVILFMVWPEINLDSDKRS